MEVATGPGMSPLAIVPPMSISLRILLLSLLGVGVAIVGFFLGTSLYELDRSISAHGVATLLPWFLRPL